MRTQVDMNTNTLTYVGFDPTPQTIWHTPPCILVLDAYHGMAAGKNFRFECMYGLFCLGRDRVG
jgi:hypothetical protein